MGSTNLLPSLLSVTRLAPQLRHHVTCTCSSFRTSAAWAGWLHKILLIFCMPAATDMTACSSAERITAVRSSPGADLHRPSALPSHRMARCSGSPVPSSALKSLNTTDPFPSSAKMMVPSSFLGRSLQERRSGPLADHGATFSRIGYGVRMFIVTGALPLGFDVERFRDSPAGALWVSIAPTRTDGEARKGRSPRTVSPPSHLRLRRSSE